MSRDSDTWLRVGAWGQLATIALAVAFWSLGASTALYATCLGYVLVTVTGIVGVARNASAFVGPLVYPFVVPGFVPLYYFAVHQTPASE
ncbi:hypothetical protein [Halobacterium jilantaiense]|uniref:Uncharacterized protein n=1 Tax=Halobacterium jilantaiense TaxID=355548 RepID=A0A1I0QM05_9EURY|nr:hypothetical protein [Halobacterium jilantaiense]SEW28089.1 hypothetical protein SAMN04487945_2720 [Halobacterium jilantaiense]